jgi:hypothetical protein
MAYAKLSPNEWQFIMVLWRLTYGRKNMSHKESGKFTTWINAEFHRRTGIERQHISRIKGNLIRKKVIIQKKGMIGFNKHFLKWDKGCYLSRAYMTSIGNTSIGTKVLPVQVTTVPSTGHTNAPQVLTSAEVQSLKKERKKETNTKDKDFDLFWGKYPKKRQKVPARKAWDIHFTKHGRFTLEIILSTLEAYMKDDWVGREPKYIPHAASWLNKHPWEDFMDSAEPEWKTEMKRRLKNLENEWSRSDMDVIVYREKRQQIINHYKEISNEA